MTARIMSPTAVNAIILNGLIVLRDRGPEVQTAGICYNLVTIVRGEADPVTKTFPPDRVRGTTVMEWLTSVFPEWPEYSGHPEYPIQLNYSDFEFAAGEEGSYDEDMESVYNRTDDQWGDHDYGRARRRLLQWLIDRKVAEIRGAFDPCSGASCQIGG